MLPETLIASLISTAKRQTWQEDSEAEGEEFLDVQSYSGGNFDDAYYGGVNDGRTEMAREILCALGVKY